MSAPQKPVEPVSGMLVHTNADRLGVSHWLRAALSEPRAAVDAWSSVGGVALLPLGTLFAAVRIPEHLAYAAAGSTEPTVVDEFLAQFLDDGPVICDPQTRRYYALVPGSTTVRWHHTAADCLGRPWYLGVPRVDAVEPDPQKWASYWAVPMPSAGVLCDPHLVAQLVGHGDRVLAAQAEEAP
ncbi:hypothetical protein ACFWBR_42235 [Streptomyces sp. NPDC060006]|uniref:hypothetical protein n=1 Tax=unclassified Streptomyces TaxID=2593676 RepID=UPI0036B73AD6